MVDSTDVRGPTVVRLATVSGLWQWSQKSYQMRISRKSFMGLNCFDFRKIPENWRNEKFSEGGSCSTSSSRENQIAGSPHAGITRRAGVFPMESKMGTVAKRARAGPHTWLVNSRAEFFLLGEFMFSMVFLSWLLSLLNWNAINLLELFFFCEYQSSCSTKPLLTTEHVEGDLLYEFPAETRVTVYRRLDMEWECSSLWKGYTETAG